MSRAFARLCLARIVETNDTHKKTAHGIHRVHMRDVMGQNRKLSRDVRMKPVVAIVKFGLRRALTQRGSVLIRLEQCRNILTLGKFRRQPVFDVGNDCLKVSSRLCRIDGFNPASPLLCDASTS